MIDNIIWISGSICKRKLFLAKIKEQFSNIYVCNSDTSLGEFEEYVYQEDCFTPKRLIILESVPSGEGVKSTIINNVKKILENVPKNCYIVLNNISGEGTKPLMTVCSKVGKVYEYEDIISKESAPSWVVKEFHNKQKTISEEAAEKFVELNGYDPYLKGISVDILQIGIDKISSYVGKKKNVEIQDVVINSFPTYEFVIWSIFDAMDEKDISKCYKFLEIFKETENNLQSVAIQILNIVLWRYRLLLFIKESIAQKKSNIEIAKEAQSLYKLQSSGEGFKTTIQIEKDQNNQNKSAYAEFSINKELNGHYNKRPGVEKYTRKELIKIIQSIYYCIEEIRFTKNEASVQFLIDYLFMNVCNVNLNDDFMEKLKPSREI